MEVKQSLRYAKTRRFTGRRSITPMRSKHKKSIQKTRHHKVEKRHVQLLKHTSTQYDGGRQGEDQNQCSEHSQREGNQDGDGQGEWKDTEILQEAELLRNTENSEKSVYPGPIQTLPHLSESQISAGNETYDKTQIEAEELAPLS